MKGVEDRLNGNRITANIQHTMLSPIPPLPEYQTPEVKGCVTAGAEYIPCADHCNWLFGGYATGTYRHRLRKTIRQNFSLIPRRNGGN